MNYIRLWKQIKNSLILNESLNIMEQMEKSKNIKFVRVKIKSWDELANSYRCDRNNTIYIREDDTTFTQNMKKFCGEEFEIAIDLNARSLFRILDKGNYFTITKHMVNYMESTGFEINKNWPIIKIHAMNTVANMCNEILRKFQKREQNKLLELGRIDYESDRKKVKVKSWDRLATEYMVDSNGNIRIESEDIIFPSQMHSLCNKEFIAEYQYDSYKVGRLLNQNGLWDITRAMVIEI